LERVERIARETVRGWWLDAQESDHTKTAYGHVADRWFEWCDRRGLDVWDARRPDVDAWRTQLRRRLAVGTVGKYLAALSSFYRYAARDVDEAPVEHNPVANVRRPKVENKSHADGLTNVEARALLAAADADGLRSAALVHLLLGTAARVSEIVNAAVTDLGWDEERRVLKVTRKGGMEGAVLIRPSVWATVERYLAERPEVPNGWLIATTGGRRMTRHTAYSVVARLARGAIARDVKIGPHDLRHTAITLALDEGIPLHEVRMFAGHASSATTERYDRRAHTRGSSSAGAVESVLWGEGPA